MSTVAKTSGSQFDGMLATTKKLDSNPEIKNDSDNAMSRTQPTLAKSKDPHFRAATLYLRKKTLAECEYRLKSAEDRRDMSELVEGLMTAWLTRSNA